MTSSLKTILLFYSAILLTNAVASFFYWRRSKDPIVGWTTCIWSGVFINFLLQGIFQEPGYLLLLAFSTYIFVSFSLLKFAESLFKFEFNKKPLLFTSHAFFILGLIIWGFSKEFIPSAYAMAIGVSLPMFFTSVLIWTHNKRNHLEPKILAILIFLNALHFLDYPLLRFEENGAHFGYSVALFLKVCFAITFPMAIIREVSAGYQDLLKKEVENQTRELKSLSAQNSTLLNLVCHDLATPVTVLNTSVGGLQKACDNFDKEQFNKYLGRVVKATAHVGEILEKVRSLQAVRSGKESLNLEAISPGPMVLEAIENAKPSIEVKNLRIKFTNLLDANDKIMADKLLLKHQVLANLISNAIKFSLTGTTIEILLSKKTEKVCIEISDQGIGIPPGILGHLFDFNVPTSRPGTMNEKGTGFGLPLVKTTLDYMGAEIQVSSKVVSAGNEISGSKFTILLDKAS